MTDEADKSRTQRLRALQAEEGKRAMAEYLANAAAVRANTERLRALRLARDAAAPKAAPSSSVAADKAAKRSRRSRTPAA